MPVPDLARNSRGRNRLMIGWCEHAGRPPLARVRGEAHRAGEIKIERLTVGRGKTDETVHSGTLAFVVMTPFSLSLSLSLSFP